MAKIHFLNVGHGDCTIIKHNDGKLTMIDINNGDELDDDSFASILDERATNPSQRSLWSIYASMGLRTRPALLTEAGYEIKTTNPVEFLKRNYPGESIFRYIQTHPDFDHLRGLAALKASGIGIQNFWDTAHSRTWNEDKDRESDKEDWDAYQHFRSGKNCTVLNIHRGAEGKYWNQNEDGNGGGNGLHLLSPTPELLKEHDEDGKRNELSYVLQYKVANRTIIFGGDAEQSAWSSIFEKYGADLKCDVLKASHHGRDSGFHLEAVKAMKPIITVVSVGKKPETDASNKYRTHSQRVWSTRWWGDLTLEIDKEGKITWTASETRYAS